MSQFPREIKSNHSDIQNERDFPLKRKGSPCLRLVAGGGALTEPVLHGTLEENVLMYVQ